jgi:FixJ family two-component response regulator
MSGRTLVSVVDDDEFVREAVPDLLRSYGIEALPFHSAEDFLYSDSLDRTGCLVLDVTMPGMSGPELQVELIRRRHEIPIVFISANYDDELGQEVLSRGAVAVLAKPFSDAALIDAVNSALARGAGD